MRSIHIRNFLFTAAIVLLCIIILGVAFISVSRTYIINEKRDTLLSTAKTVSEATAAKTADSELWDWDLRMMITSISRAANTDIIICNTDGTVVSCSDDDIISPMLGHIINSDILEDIDETGTYTGEGTLSDYYNSNCYIAGVPITVNYRSNGHLERVTVGYVFATSSLDSIHRIWVPFARIFLIVTAAVLIITLVLSLILSAREAKPLNEMASAARRFSHGDFSVRVKDSGRKDEIGELTHDFNAMADSLERSEQLRRDFIANVSHELKTPMTSIAGFADGILDGTIPQDKSPEYLEIISSETRRLSRLVKNMLDMSRIQSLNPAEVKKNSFDICELMRRTLLSLETKINSKNLDVFADIPEESVYVYGVEDAITQVLYNLLDNGIKFSYPKTEIKFSLSKHVSKVFISVINTGDDISTDELPLIFDRFHKADDSRSLDKDGAGLGLHLVKTILGSHGEDIFVSSRSHTTEFKFTMTLKRD